MENTSFLLKQIHLMTYLPVRCYDRSGEVTLFTRGYDRDADPLVCDEALKARLVAQAADQAGPKLVHEDQWMYGLCLDDMENVIVLGPAAETRPTAAQLRQYRLVHSIKQGSFYIVKKSAKEVASALSMLCFAISGKTIEEEQILTEQTDADRKAGQQTNQFTKYMMESAEFSTRAFNYADELAYIEKIRTGDLLEVEQLLPQHFLNMDGDQYGKLAENALKRIEYLACTTIVLASRAAIQGGLEPLTSYLMSDLFLQRLEKCDSVYKVLQLLPEISITFARRVRERKEARSNLSYVEQCKAYIHKHLNRPFSVDDVANSIGVDKSYLSRCFTREEGIPIMQYARKQRVEAAANMLKYSSESILTISSYLCFHSQSHFGRVFKDHIGTTPRRYREKYKVIDFVND